MDCRRPYRLWLGKRLGLFLPALLFGLGVSAYFAFLPRLAPWVRLLGLSSTALHSTLVSYLFLQTVHSASLGPEGAVLRRQLRSSRAMVLGSTISTLFLLALPLLFQSNPSSIPKLSRLRSLPHRIADVSELEPKDPVSVKEPEEVVRPTVPPQAPSTVPAQEPTVRALERPPRDPEPPRTSAPTALPDPPAPPAPASPKPQELLVLAGEPMPLHLSPQDFDIPRAPDPPPPPREEPRLFPLAQDDLHRDALKSDVDFFRLLTEITRGLPANLIRAMPDERTPEEWPDFEVRIDGLIFYSHEEGRISAMSITLDLPVSKDDSIEGSWLGALMPDINPTLDRQGDGPQAWHHVAFEFVHRVSGYTQHATFDFALGAGFTVDSFKELDAAHLSANQLHVAPQASADLAIWHEGAIGLLFHGGQSFPLGVRGSAIGVTDFSATLRVDLTQHLSLHGGYRYILVRLKQDEVVATVGSRILEDSFAGPLVGFDFRF